MGVEIKKMEIWHKLDEVILAGMLTVVCLVAMMLGYDSGVAQMCITGVVAIGAAKVAADKIKGGASE
jgi:hypothetical protein